MGLDGISINQLRITPENNSAEQNRNIKNPANNEHKVVDGLADGQKIDPDKDNKNKQNESFNSDEFSEEEEQELQEEVIKYDLSQSNKYELKVENETDAILIIEKNSKKIVQKIEAEELSNYVHFLSSSQGSIINRKF